MFGTRLRSPAWGPARLSLATIVVPVALAAVAATEEGAPAAAPQAPDGTKSAHGTAALELADLLDLPTFADRQSIDLAPDGDLMAVALVDPGEAASQVPLNDYFLPSGTSDQTLGARVFVIDPGTGAARPITPRGSVGWGPSWSPSGRLLAHYSDEDGRAGLWVWDRGANERRRVSEGIARPDFGFESPRWCGGDGGILFKALPADLTLAELDRRLPRRGGDGPPPGPPALGPRITLLASLPELLPAVAGSGSAAAGDSVDGVSWTNKYLADLVLADPASGASRRLVAGARILAFSCSPDGRNALYTEMRWVEEPGGGGRTAYSVHVVDLPSGAAALLAPEALDDYGITLSWSPDSRQLAWIDADGALVVATGDTPESPASTWTPRQRLIPPQGVGLRNDYRPPLWTATGKRIHLLADDVVLEADLERGVLREIGSVPGHDVVAFVGDVEGGRSPQSADGSLTLLVREHESLGAGMARLAHDGSAAILWTAALSAGPDFPYHLDVAGDRVVFVAQSATRPQEVWSWESGATAPRRLSNLHARIGRLVLGSSQLVEWRSAAGERVRGTLLLPPASAQELPAPTIVQVYPGQRGERYVHRFGLVGPDAYNLHLLATRGFAVFVPSVPFSPGKPLEGFVDAVVPGIDRLIELGLADPERIGITGASAGGYAALGLLTRVDRWRAAIVEQGYGNLFGDYLQMRPDGTAVGVARVEGYLQGMGATPWENGMLQAYIDQSPLFALERVRAPVMLVHGDADRTVPIELSHQTFVALRRLGKPVVLATYGGEGHGVGGWRRDNLEDYWARTVAWWHRWLATPGEAR